MKIESKDGAEPLVSIVIPCYEGARYLPQAIESVLNQSYRNLQVLIVDDASPDNCAEIAGHYAARDPRVQVIRRSKNGGVSAAFNSGFEVAKGEFFSRLAQDDYFRDDAIEVMLTELRKNPDAGMVYCDDQHVDEDGNFLRFARKGSPGLSVKANAIGLCVMWRRLVWEKVGKFDSAYDAAEDYEYWLRVRQHFRLCHCPDAPLFVRIHDRMGSRVFYLRQSLLNACLAAKHTPSFVARRRGLAEDYFEIGYNVGLQKQKRTALRLLLQSIWYWPFSLKPYKCFVKFLLFP